MPLDEPLVDEPESCDESPPPALEPEEPDEAEPDEDEPDEPDEPPPEEPPPEDPPPEPCPANGSWYCWSPAPWAMRPPERPPAGARSRPERAEWCGACASSTRQGRAPPGNRASRYLLPAMSDADPRGRPRHILVLTDRDWTHPQGGGTGTNLYGQIARWVAWGHRVTVVAGAYPGAQRDERLGPLLTVHRMGTRLTVFPRGGLGASCAAGRRATPTSCSR